MCRGRADKNIASDTSAAKMVEGPTCLCRGPLSEVCEWIREFHISFVACFMMTLIKDKTVSKCIVLKYYYYVRLWALTLANGYHCCR